MTQKKKPSTTTKSSPSARRRERTTESDSTYLLKLVVFVLLGTFWVKFSQPVSWQGIPFVGVPVGLLIGLLLVRRFEPMQIDRKIWYAILIIVTIICCFAPVGILI